jgi:hypothetical protein
MAGGGNAIEGVAALRGQGKPALFEIGQRTALISEET